MKIQLCGKNELNAKNLDRGGTKGQTTRRLNSAVRSTLFGLSSAVSAAFLSGLCGQELLTAENAEVSQRSLRKSGPKAATSAAFLLELCKENGLGDPQTGIPNPHSPYNQSTHFAPDFRY